MLLAHDWQEVGQGGTLETNWSRGISVASRCLHQMLIYESPCLSGLVSLKVLPCPAVRLTSGQHH